MGEHSMRSENYEGASGENDSYFQGEKNERMMIVAYLRTLAAEADEKKWPGRAVALREAADKIERIEHPTWTKRVRPRSPH